MPVITPVGPAETDERETKASLPEDTPSHAMEPRGRFRRDPDVARGLRSLEERLLPGELRQVFDRLVATLEAPASSTQEAALVTALSGGSTFTRTQRIDLEAKSLGRYFARRRELLQDALSTTQVAALLGTSRQTPHDRVRAGTLLAVEDGGQSRFPAWQFDPAGPHGVVAGLPDLLRALNVSPLAKVSWLQTINPYLEGRTPLEALKAGELQRVLPAARAVGVS